MKALTIWQPWASLIIEGAKPFEFRGWNVAHRFPKMIGQRIVIHAAARKIDRQEIFALRRALLEGGDPAAETCLYPNLALPVLDRALKAYTENEFGLVSLAGHGVLPWSAGLGTAVIGMPRLGTEVAEEFGVPRANDSDRDEHANWAWPMLDIEKWDTPIPMKGAQGFWNWRGPESVGL